MERINSSGCFMAMRSYDGGRCSFLIKTRSDLNPDRCEGCISGQVLVYPGGSSSETQGSDLPDDRLIMP